MHKLFIGEFDEIDYQLIAIHTSLEEYRLAFILNQKLGVLLQRSKEGILITDKNGSAELARYEYLDDESNTSWNLLANKAEVLRNAPQSSDLFSGQGIRVSRKAYLIPEYKNVDYFLQLNHADEIPTNLMSSLQTIGQINMSYSVSTDTIKSKNNLIF